MFANRYTALIDACVLVSAPRRDLLLTLAEAEFFRLRWSRNIISETQSALHRIFAERDFQDHDARAARAVAAMQAAFPEALVDDQEGLEPLTFGLPDANDEHVLSAAVQTQAQAIVTDNLADFPAAILSPLNIEARTADDFIADTIALDEGKAVAAIRAMRVRLRRPEMSPQDFLKSLETHRLFVTASILSNHADSI
ncbi:MULTISPECIES: PIN domain-containing protein [Sphingomonadales]|jgi:predicted nucleic acid-binding protein|uniref:PIN domain-containing protein n=1 Tax=Sphingomonadales TaxID=204457 RepID=UPI000826E93E|nr:MULTISPECIES: PIN domain-containing protein [Sphingomonadales]